MSSSRSRSRPVVLRTPSPPPTPTTALLRSQLGTCIRELKTELVDMNRHPDSSRSWLDRRSKLKSIRTNLKSIVRSLESADGERDSMRRLIKNEAAVSATQQSISSAVNTIRYKEVDGECYHQLWKSVDELHDIVAAARR